LRDRLATAYVWPPVSEQPHVIVRTHKARSQEQAAALFQADAARLTTVGYRPTPSSATSDGLAAGIA